MIDVHHLTKRFGAILAVDAVSFIVPRGEVLGFLGPNGAGKSTTMKMTAGFLNPTSGTALLNGIDVIKELHALHDAAAVGVEARDQSGPQHATSSRGASQRR